MTFHFGTVFLYNDENGCGLIRECDTGNSACFCDTGQSFFVRDRWGRVLLQPRVECINLEPVEGAEVMYTLDPEDEDTVDTWANTQFWSALLHFAPEYRFCDAAGTVILGPKVLESLWNINLQFPRLEVRGVDYLSDDIGCHGYFEERYPVELGQSENYGWVRISDPRVCVRKQKRVPGQVLDRINELAFSSPADKRFAIFRAAYGVKREKM